MAQGLTYVGTVLLRDHHNHTRRMVFSMPDVAGADEATVQAAAKAAFEALLTDLNAVTDANIDDAYLAMRDADWAQVVPGIPANDSEVRDEAVLIGAIAADKFAAIAIPAPVDGIWLAGSNGNVVDLADADVLAYFDNFDEGGEIEVSDGETFNSALYTSGIVKGYWRQRADRARGSTS